MTDKLMGREAFIERLQNGELVKMRVCGNSMTPIMKTGDKELVEPILDYTKIKKGDAVFCKVKSMLTIHKVTGIRKTGDILEFQISNNHGHVNGWTPQGQVFGKLIHVEKRVKQ